MMRLLERWMKTREHRQFGNGSYRPKMVWAKSLHRPRTSVSLRADVFEMSEGVLQAHVCWLEEIPEEILLSGLRWHLQRLTDFHLKTILISHHSLHANAKGIAHQESLCLFSWWESRKPLKLVEKLACQLSLTSRLGKTEGARYTLPQQRSDGSVTLEQTQDTATSM